MSDKPQSAGPPPIQPGEVLYDLVSPQGHHFYAIAKYTLVRTDRVTPGKFVPDDMFTTADLAMPQYEFNEWDIYEIDATGKRMATIRAEGPQPTTGPDSYGDAEYRSPEELAKLYPPGSPMRKVGEELKKLALSIDSSSGYENNTSLPPDIRRLPLPQQDVYRMTYNSAKAANLSSEQAKSNAEQALRDMAG